jgi:hypothetical protein
MWWPSVAGMRGCRSVGCPWFGEVRSGGLRGGGTGHAHELVPRAPRPVAEDQLDAGARRGVEHDRALQVGGDRAVAAVDDREERRVLRSVEAELGELAGADGNRVLGNPRSGVGHDERELGVLDRLQPVEDAAVVGLEQREGAEACEAEEPVREHEQAAGIDLDFTEAGGSDLHGNSVPRGCRVAGGLQSAGCTGDIGRAPRGT